MIGFAVFLLAVLATASAIRATFWFLHVTTDRSDDQ